MDPWIRLDQLQELLAAAGTHQLVVLALRTMCTLLLRRLLGPHLRTEVEMLGEALVPPEFDQLPDEVHRVDCKKELVVEAGEVLVAFVVETWAAEGTGKVVPGMVVADSELSEGTAVTVVLEESVDTVAAAEHVQGLVEHKDSVPGSGQRIAVILVHVAAAVALQVLKLAEGTGSGNFAVVAGQLVVVRIVGGTGMDLEMELVLVGILVELPGTVEEQDKGTEGIVVETAVAAAGCIEKEPAEDCLGELEVEMEFVEYTVLRTGKQLVEDIEMM